jgi:hypothetical protein
MTIYVPNKFLKSNITVVSEMEISGNNATEMFKRAESSRQCVISTKDIFIGEDHGNGNDDESRCRTHTL